MMKVNKMGDMSSKKAMMNKEGMKSMTTKKTPGTKTLMKVKKK